MVIKVCHQAEVRLLHYRTAPGLWQKDHFFQRRCFSCWQVYIEAGAVDQIGWPGPESEEQV